MRRNRIIAGIHFLKSDAVPKSFSAAFRGLYCIRVGGIITSEVCFMKQTKTRRLVQTALLTSLVILLAFVPYIGYIRVPFLAIQATTVHIPVIVGSILLGPVWGGFLGFVFGLTSLINNTVNPGITSFCFSPLVAVGENMGGSPLALIICFVPRILCGVVPFYISKLISGAHPEKLGRRRLSFLAAGVCGSLTNTILVMSMIFIFFGHAYARAKGIAYEAVIGVVMSVVGINGTIEAVIAALISTAACAAVLKLGTLNRKKR